MTSPRIKAEISELLDQLPESSLQYILDLLKEIQSKSSDGICFVKSLQKTLAEDKELLKKLV
jgi:hypothetical protein